MKNKLFYLLFFCFTFLQSNAQNDAFWTLHNNNINKIIETDKGVSRESFPKEFQLYALNLNQLRDVLFASKSVVNGAKTIITLPNVNGQLEQFEVFEASNFEDDLQAQFPEIRAYSGQGITDKYATLKLSISPQGIQTMVFRTDKPNEFIEPYSKDHTVYAVFKSNRTKGNLAWSCTTEDKNMMTKVAEQIPASNFNKFNDTTLRTMRLAQSCNGEYANYFGASSAAQVGLVLAAFNATLTRCNGVYEKDLALHLNLVAGTTNIIYYNPTSDPYTTLTNWNTQLQNAISTTLTGSGTSLAANNAAYDIGHMFGASGGGGNAGCIGCVCVNAVAAGTGSTKGRGITSPSNNIPQGDNFDIDYVVHEIGHQLGGNHTFSHSSEGSGVNMEVGSGVTIMGYAGITPYDVAAHSIDKYHAATIAQIQANLVNRLCIVNTNISANNATPTVNAGLDYIIPISTPYILTAIGADANINDALTYSWEQYDDAASSTGASSSADINKTIGPNFISWDAMSSPSRYFPQITSIIANSPTTDQVGGDAPMLSEALSAVGRELNFRVTVRDNVPYRATAPIQVGQTNFDDMKITVTPAAGPFTVTAPDTSVFWAAGTNQNVTWTVAGTNANGVNAGFVDIFLSIDGGYTYPIQLANKVPNDGSEIITVPNNVGSNNRIMVKGNNHVFFDISNVAFTIAAPVSTFAITQASEQTKQFCTATSTSFIFNYSVLAGFAGTTTFSAVGGPAGASAVFSPATANSSGLITLTLSGLTNASGNYNILVNATSGGVTKVVPFYLFLGLGNPSLIAPANNAVAQSTSVPLSWNPDPSATSYDLQVSTVNTFTSTIVSTSISATTYNLAGLNQGTDYYWRILPKNATCTGNFGSFFKFTTGTLTCGTNIVSTNVPITIPTTVATVTSTLNVPSGFNIGDVNVDLNITHSYLSDITVTLTSPSGTMVTLIGGSCGSNNNLNATFDDNGNAVNCATSTGTNTFAVSGVVLPVNLLSAFNGQNSAGTWTLTVVDGFDVDGGAINSWGLSFCRLDALGIESNVFENFALYPNPNNGEFNIKLVSNSTDGINVQVSDIGGRRVYDKTFANTNIFEQNITVDNLNTGIYLVTVSDGIKKIVKKIVVK